MQFLYLAAFIAGLLLIVYAMIRGVERVGRTGLAPELDAFGRPTGTPRMALSAPAAGAFATVFGVTGYLLWRFALLSPSAQLVVCVAAGVLATWVATRAVVRWAVQAAEQDVVDERYLLQGHPADVVTSISATEAGEIAYEVAGRRYAVAAKSLDGTPVAAGTEVVIDRVEDGVAYVEPWVQVEQRL